MTHVEGGDRRESARAGWYDDPLAPGHRRHWDGAAWTALVSTGSDSPTGLHWTPTLSDLPPPELRLVAPPAVFWAPPPGPVLVFHAATGTETAPVAAGTSPLPMPAPVVVTSLAGVDPMLAAFGAETRTPPPVHESEAHRRRRLAPVVIAAAVALIAGAVVAGAGILRPDDQRPRLVSEQAYRDNQAGFTVRYPDAWQVLRRDEGAGIRFAVGAKDASAANTNTVSVVVGTEAAALPELHTLADQLTETLREELPGVRLATATRTRLADAPGFRFAFRDPDATPATRIEQYVGRTISGRPLTVTVTIREPRSAPTAQELRDFVESLDPS